MHLLSNKKLNPKISERARNSHKFPHRHHSNNLFQLVLFVVSVECVSPVCCAEFDIHVLG